MDMISLQCPNCHGTIQAENGLDTYYCMYCGNKIFLSGLSDAAYKARTDAEKIKTEAKANLRREKIDQYRWEQETNNKDRQHKREVRAKSILYRTLSFLFLLLFSPILITTAYFFVEHYKDMKIHNDKVNELKEMSSNIEDYIKNEEYDKALELIDDLYLDDYYFSWFGNDPYDKYYWEDQRNAYFEQIRNLQHESDDYEFIDAPLDCTDCSEYTKTEMIDLFEDAGFENIITESVRGSAGLFSEKNTVSYVTIDGNSEFTERDEFIEDAEVIIYYYKK